MSAIRPTTEVVVLRWRSRSRLRRARAGLSVPPRSLGPGALAQLLGGAELHEFAAGVDDRDVAGRQVERVAGFEDLVVVGEAIGNATLEHIPPVRAWAVVVGQPLQQRGAVDVRIEADEVDGVAIDVLVVVLDRAVPLDVRCAVLRYLRHLRRLLSLGAS